MELIVLSIVCSLIGLGCLGGAAFAVLGGEDVGVERIFIVLVWLMFGGMFLSLAGWIARQGPLRKTEKKSEEAAAEAHAAATSGKQGAK